MKVLYMIKTMYDMHRFNMFLLNYTCSTVSVDPAYSDPLSYAYISTKDYVLCDSLSRLDLDESVKRIRDTMSKDSLCCYHLFNDG